MKWAIKTGNLTPAQVGHVLAQANAPLWAVKTADKPSSISPTMILNAEAWKKTVKEINDREKAIYLADREGRRMKPKSMLPLYVVKLKQEVSRCLSSFAMLTRNAQTPRGTQAQKSGGRGWAGPRGPGSRSPSSYPWRLRYLTIRIGPWSIKR
jgi:hypothetical protein